MEVTKVIKDVIFLIEAECNSITFGIQGSKIKIAITEDMLINSEEITLVKDIDVEVESGLAAIFTYAEVEYYIHINDANVYCTPYLNGHSSMSVDLDVVLYSPRFELISTRYSYSLVDNISKNKVDIDSNLFNIGVTEVLLGKTRNSNEPYIYAKVSYKNFNSFLEYTIATESYSLKSLNYYFYYNPEGIQVDFKSNNQMILSYEGNEITCLISKLVSEKKILLPKVFTNGLTKPIFLKLNNYVFLLKYIPSEGKSFIFYDKRADLLFNKTNFYFKNSSEGITLHGFIDYKNNIPIDSAYTNRGIFLGKVVWHGAKKFTVKIPSERLINIKNIHSTIMFKTNNKPIHSAYFQSEKEVKHLFSLPFLVGENAYIPRLYDSNVFGITKLPKLPVYEKKHQFQVNLAYYLSKLAKPFVRNKINLYFEKDAKRACESSLYVFDKVQSMSELKSKNFFILDTDSPQFNDMKEKFGDKIISRFSFRHYYYIFMSDTFIASELSNHVIATRVLNDKLNTKIRKTPLYFLQHGIMFAKPVDNPMAMGFHKINQVNNVRKNVISSDLEAKEFYKMGYDDSDLMKTGLPKLDGAFLKDTADKITYMPTWRFWEESYVINDDIENTTYFKSLMTVIKLFEREGLIDRLLIAPHNKFSEYIYNHMNEYKDIICVDPTEALEVSVIFITDYSSIIYDAAYRGAFPIFYWKDSDYLIDKYQAIPPVNKTNAPGVIAWTDEELMIAVKDAIKDNYHLSQDIVNKYRMVNEFYDNKNTERVIDYLLKDDIL
ncbi:hypothetical protein IGI37_001192 [Enterococcus sp. AZ194]|uniref:CDP-glycerol glycerophosphotransferase family protein n=1 Tax=Enterococcus sp. AZ194 TaxID=2774629 RepID=UPI003F1FBC46